MNTHPCANCNTSLPPLGTPVRRCAFCGAKLVETPLGFVLAQMPIESRGEIEKRERALREVCCG